MRYLLLPGILFLYFQTAFGQANISGRIFSKIKTEPLPGVTVILDRTNEGTVSDAEGNYSLAVSPGKHTLTFRLVGMKEQTLDADVQEFENKILIVLLEEEATQLGLVVVSASKFEQRIEDVTVSMNVIKPALVEDRNT